MRKSIYVTTCRVSIVYLVYRNVNPTLDKINDKWIGQCMNWTARNVAIMKNKIELLWWSNPWTRGYLLSAMHSKMCLRINIPDLSWVLFVVYLYVSFAHFLSAWKERQMWCLVENRSWFVDMERWGLCDM